MINFTNSLYLLLITSRLSTSFVASFLVFLVIGINDNASFYVASVHGIIFLFITMYGFIINDILDYSKDRIAKRKRPIAENKLSRKFALLFSIIIVIISLLLDLTFGNINSIIVICSTIVLLTLYSYISKYIPVLKGIITGILCLTPVFYANSINDLNIYFLIYILIFFFIFGRELYMDAQDLKGDLLSELKTIPFYLGEDLSKKLGFLFMILSLFSLFTYSILFLNHINIILSGIALTSCLYAALISIKYENKAISITKITMLLAISSIFYISG